VHHGLARAPARREVLGQAAGLEHRPTVPMGLVASVEGDDGHDWPPVGAGSPVRDSAKGTGRVNSLGTAAVPSCSQQEAERVPASSSNSGGASWRQRSKAKRQRGWKVHPVGALRRSGGEPGMPSITRRGPCSEGNELSRPREYGCRGARKIAFARPCSTSRPAYMTAIESAISASSERSCEMN